MKIIKPGKMKGNFVADPESTYVKLVLKEHNTAEKNVLEERAEKQGITVLDYVRHCCILEPPKLRNNCQKGGSY